MADACALDLGWVAAINEGQQGKVLTLLVSSPDAKTTLEPGRRE